MRYFTVIAECGGPQFLLYIPVKIEGSVNSISLIEAAEKTRGYSNLRMTSFHEWDSEEKLMEYHNPPLPAIFFEDENVKS